MTTGNKKLEQQYDSEREAFENQLLPKIKEILESHPLEICILSGDFNNASHKHSLNDKFNKEIYDDKPNPYGYSQINYNLNIIKDTLESEPYNFEMADKKDDEKGGVNGGIPTMHCYKKNATTIFLCGI